MTQRVYVQTTIISYLIASSSRDLVVAAHQQVTRDWWSARDGFELCVSQFVVEASADAAERRTAAVEDPVLLEITGDATTLAAALIGRGGLPAKAERRPRAGSITAGRARGEPPKALERSRCRRRTCSTDGRLASEDRCAAGPRRQRGDRRFQRLEVAPESVPRSRVPWRTGPDGRGCQTTTLVRARLVRRRSQ